MASSVHSHGLEQFLRNVADEVGEDQHGYYSAAPGEHVAIKGSERIAGWVEQLADAVERTHRAGAGGVWQARVPNALFGDFNPYTQVLRGDWRMRPALGRRRPLTSRA
ncbi:MAG: hypothetical protein LBG11_09840 [Bifidobacteriaceae bacterium]|nr:hypothetical protein [Bifidobacteriaceae bacterium]